MTTPLDGAPAGRVAIVTGGSRGVGRATVRSLASRGYAVVVNYLHDQRAAESTVEAILADNGTAVAVRADVADELDVERLFAETIEAFGGDRRRRPCRPAAGSPRPTWPRSTSTSSTPCAGSTRGPP